MAHDTAYARQPAFIASKKARETARNTETSWSNQLVSEWQKIQWSKQKIELISKNPEEKEKRRCSD